jgi:hypothetical protein
LSCFLPVTATVAQAAIEQRSKTQGTRRKNFISRL